MAKLPFDVIADSVIGALIDAGLARHSTRKRVHAKSVFVSNFRFADMDLSLNFTPHDDGTVSVDFVPGTPPTITRSLGQEYGARSAIIRNAPLDEAVAAAITLLRRIAAAAGPRQTWAIPRTATPRRVGILTLPMTRNFGGNLQAFALMEVLASAGHRPLLINRRWAPRGYVDDPDSPRNAIRYTSSFRLGAGVANGAFLDANVSPLTRPFYGSNDLARNFEKLDLDALVVGSDQAWRSGYTSGLLGDFFFKFAGAATKPIRRASYAVSFGVDEWDYTDAQTKHTATLIRKFDAVSVREDVGVRMCRDIYGVEAQHVLDPTLLLPPERYRELFEGVPESATRRIVTYVLDASDDKARVLEAISARLGLPVYATNGLEYAGGSPIAGGAGDNSVEQWLRSISEAEFVITDSFHGMVFSILFNKPFIAYGNAARGMSRFTSLLGLLALEDRLVLDAANLDIVKALQPIDWQAVNARLAEEREKSLRFLEHAVTGTDPGEVTFESTPVADGAPVDNPLGVMCTGCGACASEPDSGLRMAFNADGYIFPKAVAAKIDPNAVRVCPFNPAPEEAVRDETRIGEIFFPAARHVHPRAGRFENSYVGYCDPLRKTSSSGGMATFVLTKLLALKIVDEIFVVTGDGEKGYAYAFFDKVEDITQTSKTRYFPVTLEKLFDEIGGRPGRVAVTGVGCFIKAIRLKQHYRPALKQKIAFTVGIICGGLKSALYTDHLAQAASIEGDYRAPQYRVKNPSSGASDYIFAAHDADNNEHRVRMKTLGDMWGSGLFKSKACDFCSDVTTELADISVGDAWLPEYVTDGMGHSIMVTRTALADYIVRSAASSGEIELEEIGIDRVLTSQAGGMNHKLGGLLFRRNLLAAHTDLPIPAVRDYLSAPMDASNGFVQILRDRVRHKSLKYWQETRDFARFNRRMRASRRLLQTVTHERNKNPRVVNSAVRQVLADDRTASHPVRSARVMLRWLTIKLTTGQTSREEIATLIRT